MAASGSRSLLVAANRGPVSISTGPDGREDVRRGGGGLVSGMVSALSEVGGLWVCAALNDRERAAARRAPDGHLAEAGYDTGGLDVRMLPLDPSTFARAYNGIANSTIWFVHHLLYDSANSPVFDAGWRRLWAAYERYNRSFADALAAEAAPGAKVMVQDYHLDLAPRQLRERRDDVRIAHFTHTPWAPPEDFAMLPDAVGREILTGLLGADHVGFHSPRWSEAFLRLLRPLPRRRRGPGRRHRALGGPHRADRRAPARRPPRPRSGPAAHEEDSEAGLTELRDVIGDRKVISRVDRTELSKNIVRGPAGLPRAAAVPAGVARTGRARRVRVPVAGPTSRNTASTPPRCSGPAGRSSRSSAPTTGTRCCSTSRTTTRARWPRCGWPTCCWSTRSGTG